MLGAEFPSLRAEDQAQSIQAHRLRRAAVYCSRWPVTLSSVGDGRVLWGGVRICAAISELARRYGDSPQVSGRPAGLDKLILDPDS